MKFNFGEEEFKFPPKDGFVALSKAPDNYVVKSQQTGTSAPQRERISRWGAERTPVGRASPSESCLPPALV